MQATVQWQNKMKFSGVAGSGHEVIMDASPDVGGEDTGNRPKEMILHGLAGCTGMDVISILNKMRVSVEDFRVEVKVEQSQDHPKIFEKIHLKYFFKGNVSEQKVKKAIDLSQDKYCGVSAMLKNSSEITYEYVIEK